MIDLKKLCEELNQGDGDGFERRPRCYVGASGIGDPCHAYQSFCMRGFPGREPSNKLQRIFDIGHALEPLVIRALADQGMVVHERDPLTGKQHHFEAYGGHFAGNLDGIAEIEGEPWVIEVKTMMAKKWREFIKHGVKKSHPKYYAQLHACMGLSGILRSMLVSINKDTAEIAIQVVEFDVLEWEAIDARAEGVIKRGESDRVSSNPEGFTCRWCFKRDICWYPEHVIPKRTSCPQCKHSTPNYLVKGGKWTCGLNGATHPASYTCREWEEWRPKEPLVSITPLEEDLPF